jgi:molecular chaperone GrpE
MIVYLFLGTIGDIFDPDLHDALFAVPDETKTSGTVSQVLNNGYKLKDRVLRPAQVGTIA